MITSLLLLITIVHCSFTLKYALHQPDAEAVIGVSMCFRSPSESNTCNVEGYSHISECYESMLWSIDNLNQNSGNVFGVNVSDSYIPGIKLGLKTFDDCGQTDIALRNIKCITSNSSRNRTDSYLLGMIGSCGIKQTKKMARKLRLFNLPLLNPLFGTLSWSQDGLSKYSNLYKVFPHDGLNELYKVIISLIQEFKWDKVSVLFEDDIDWKRNLAKSFISEASSYVCIGHVINVPKNCTSQIYKRIIQTLLDSRPSTGIIYLSGSNTTLAKLLHHAETFSNVSYLNWIIYDTDNMEFVVENHINFMRGAYLIQHNNIRPKGLIEYIYKKKPLIPYANDPWFVYYFMKTKNCYLPNYNIYPYNENPSCSSETYDKEYLLTYTFHPYCINSIYIFANALKNAWGDKCNGQRGMCKNLKNLSPNAFSKQYLKKVNFMHDDLNRSPPELHNTTIRFDSNNQLIDRQFKYGIRNLQVKSGFKYPKVFSYEENRLKQLGKYKFYDIDGISLGDNIPPASSCDSINCSNDVCLTISQVNI